MKKSKAVVGQEGETPTWDEFAWAAFLYKAMVGGDNDYQGLMEQDQFLKNLRTNPAGVEPAKIQDPVIKFLNRWRCRTPNNPEAAEAILDALRILQPCLQALSAFEIETVDFDHPIIVNGNQITVHEAIAKCYRTLNELRGFGATMTSKLLHILQPKLFIMWDSKILNHYWQSDQQVQDSGAGYCAFLQAVKEIEERISQSFMKAVSPDEANQGPAVYLSMKLEYDPPKTMAKYLDEYNWVKFANEVEVPPPSWLPMCRPVQSSTNGSYSSGANGAIVNRGYA